MKHLIRPASILGATVLAATCLAAVAAGAASPNAQMRQAMLTLRGLIDRRGAERYFTYPKVRTVYPRRLVGSGAWPDDPWTGRDMLPGRTRGHYRYTVSPDRRRYRLVGYTDGGVVVLSGGMPTSIMRAYDHRGEEGLNLIRQYVEDHAARHDGLYPSPTEVSADGAVRL